MEKRAFVEELTKKWETEERWRGIERPYSAEDVYRLRGSYDIEYSLAKLGAERLWKLLHEEDYVAALSAVTGNQAIQNVKAGLKAIYVSGWQVAGDANNTLEVYPDQSIYPSNSVPTLVNRINNALLRADQIHHLKEDDSTHWLAPIVADAEAGFGGTPHAYELMKWMVREGVSAVHYEDQLSSAKKCGHMGGKVIIPSREFISKLTAARLATDVLGVDTLIIARTDALGATLLANDIDPYDKDFLTGERTHEGFYRVKNGIEAAISRGLAYAPYADILWFETGTPDINDARKFSEAIHEKFPGKLLAYNCSPSFNWKKYLNDDELLNFQKALGGMGYKFQFVTLSAFHALNYSMFTLANDFRNRGMAAYADLQSSEFDAEPLGYEATRHQDFVGAGYFDEVTQVATGGQSSTLAMKGSTEEEQF